MKWSLWGTDQKEGKKQENYVHQGQFQPTSVPQGSAQMLGWNNGEKHTKIKMDEQKYNGPYLAAGMAYSI